MGRKHIPQSAGDEDQDIKAIIQRSRYCEESVPDTAAVPKSPHKRKESVAKRLNFTQRVREIAALAKTFQKDLEIKRRCADALATLVNAEVRRKFAGRIPSVFDVRQTLFAVAGGARARDGREGPCHDMRACLHGRRGNHGERRPGESTASAPYISLSAL